MANAPFPIIPELTAIAVAYKNNRLIADDVLPRVPVTKQEFRYTKYALGDGFTIPDTKVGRTSAPTQIEWGATQTTDQTQDHALDTPIPQADLENVQPPFNPEGRATELIANLIALDREVRASALVFNAANYAAGNQSDLNGGNEWSGTTANPIFDITRAIDKMVMRPNIMVMGRAVYTVLSTHPDIVKAFYGALAGDQGIVKADFLAQLFEMDACYVGEGWVNTAHRGQTPTLARVWGKDMAMIYRDSLATATQGVTFGFTAQWGSRVAGRLVDPDLGMRGGVRIRVGESLKELITANDLGYLFQNAVVWHPLRFLTTIKRARVATSPARAQLFRSIMGFEQSEIDAMLADSPDLITFNGVISHCIFIEHDTLVQEAKGADSVVHRATVMVNATDFTDMLVNDLCSVNGVNYSVYAKLAIQDGGMFELTLQATDETPGDSLTLIAAKEYTDQQVAEEAAIRAAADADLQNQIDNIPVQDISGKADITYVDAQDVAVKAYSDANLSDEVTARQVADADEAAQRNGQDLIILDALNLKADFTYVDAADTVLQDQINLLAGGDLSSKADVTYVDAQDAAEASLRAAADVAEATARTNADALKADKTYVDSQDAAEVTARNAAITVETNARIAADALKADKTYVDSQDAAEVTARNAAITVETNARIAADALKADKTYVDSQDAAEVTARNAAITVETNARIAADALKQNLLTGTGLARNTGAATELSGDATTSGSNVVTVTKINGATPAAIAISGAWSDLQAPTADLTLSAAGFNSEFDHTSAATWKWRNTTLATNSTTNGTPSLNLSANYWTGAASAEDNWKISASLAAGTNGIPTLTIAHSGSTGQSVVSIPGNFSFFQQMSGRTDVNILNSGNSQIALQGNSGFAAKSSDSLSVLDHNNTHGKFSTTLQNTTAATSGVPQSSETLYLEGRYWTGAASAADNWSIQDVIGSGTNGSSFLTFTHSGSSGSIGVIIPAGSGPTVAALSLAAVGTNWGLYKTAGGRLGICAGGSGVLVVYASQLTHTAAAGGLVWSSTSDPEGTLDAGLTRISAGLLGIGNGAASDFSAALKLTTLNNQGGAIVKRAAKAANYTSTATDYCIVFTATATLTLDSAAAVAGTLYRVKLSTAAAGGSVLTITPNNSKTIEGVASQSITILGGSIDVVYDGASNWEVF